MAVFFGLGSSLKYACDRTSVGMGRLEGLRERRVERRAAPEVVRRGNLMRR